MKSTCGSLTPGRSEEQTSLSKGPECSFLLSDSPGNFPSKQHSKHEELIPHGGHLSIYLLEGGRGVYLMPHPATLCWLCGAVLVRCVARHSCESCMESWVLRPLDCCPPPGLVRAAWHYWMGSCSLCQATKPHSARGLSTFPSRTKEGRTPGVAHMGTASALLPACPTQRSVAAFLPCWESMAQSRNRRFVLAQVLWRSQPWLLSLLSFVVPDS